MTRGGRRKTGRSNWATNRCELKGLPSLGNSFPWLLEADFYFNTEWYHACVQNLEVVRLACVTHNVQTNVWMSPIGHKTLHSLLYIFDVAPPLHFPRFLQPFYLPPIGSEIIEHWSVTNQLLPNQNPYTRWSEEGSQSTNKNCQLWRRGDKS